MKHSIFPDPKDPKADQQADAVVEDPKEGSVSDVDDGGEAIGTQILS